MRPTDTEMASPRAARLEDIADLLAEYREVKERQKILREEMVRLAVEALGMDQQEAMKKSDQLHIFLDGYLVGQGIQQSWRNMK